MSTPQQTAALTKPRRRILVIEDNADGRESLRTILEIWGFEVEAAADGQQGVAKALAWNPNVAVVDIGLPILDGYEVARQLRSALGAAVYLVALTAYGQPEDRRAAFCAGFDAHLTKPAKTSSALANLLGNMISHLGPPRPAGDGETRRDACATGSPPDSLPDPDTLR